VCLLVFLPIGSVLVFPCSFGLLVVDVLYVSATTTQQTILKELKNEKFKFTKNSLFIVLLLRLN